MLWVNEHSEDVTTNNFHYLILKILSITIQIILYQSAFNSMETKFINVSENKGFVWYKLLSLQSYCVNLKVLDQIWLKVKDTMLWNLKEDKWDMAVIRSLKYSTTLLKAYYHNISI